ncbi:unnamed protein product [Spirodela intermedia]|uniref:mannan endo-1,4-beta-mannosidase n=1 Tax=Spirodela intermedia TaxID=51605 RepID=A0A7I8JSR0_SPIIN|nr:unnamed protein product [Spirodela intermedia]CAA6673237.1 unnamed protein product [Spirodela intermedia]
MLNGDPFFANGFNAYWLMAWRRSRRRGQGLFRLQAGLPPWPRHSQDLGLQRRRQRKHQRSPDLPGVYDERVFQGLDFVISEAGKYGIRLILSLTNNYDSFGGKRQYASWARSQGQAISSDDEFFTNPSDFVGCDHEVNKFTGVAYRDDPTIFAWELMNEPRCPSDPSGKTVQDWIAEMAAYVKSVDGNHLLEAGLEGFYGQSAPAEKQFVADHNVGTDFIANNQIKGIDFATVHSYPDQWLPAADEEAQLGFLNRWLDAHLEDAREVLRKPLLVAEFGKSSRSPASPPRRGRPSSAPSTPRSTGPLGPLLAEGMESYGDGYEVVLEELHWTTSNLIAQNCRKLRHLGKLIARLRDIGRLELIPVVRSPHRLSFARDAKN